LQMHALTATKQAVLEAMDRTEARGRCHTGCFSRMDFSLFQSA
jgi:hypothetical protein